MAIVSTGMHDARILAAERKTGMFFNRQCINICTQCNGLAVRGRFSTFDHCPETVVIRVIVRDKSHLLQTIPDFMCGIFFFKRKLRMCVKITSLFNDPGFILFCHISKVHGDFLSVLSI